MFREVKPILSSLSQRLRLVVSKAILDVVDDSTPLQTCKIGLYDDEVDEGVERIQEYGFSSVPPKGSEAVAFEVGGSRDQLLVLGTDSHDFRPVGGLSGEACMYTQFGHLIKLASDGSVMITTPGSQGQVMIDGNLTVTGTSTFTGAVSMLSTLTVVGDLLCQAALTGLTVTAGLIPAIAVKLLTHVHAAVGSPPTPGS